MQTSQHEIQEAKTLLNQISFEKYKDLNHLSGDPYEGLENIKNRIKEHISEIIILKIEEDFITQNSLLPKELQRFKDFGEGRGFNYYILKTQDEINSVFLGAFGGTTARTNDFYMKEILKDPELKEKTRIISTSYADLIEDDQKE